MKCGTRRWVGLLFLRQSFEEAKENVAATPAEFVSDDGADVPAEAPREEATNDLVAAPPPLTEAR